VWQVAEVVVTGANAATNAHPQPGFYIFTKKYYSTNRVTSTEPRPAIQPKDPNNTMDAEKIALYEELRQFTGNAGTYEIQGSTLTIRPLVARRVQVMSSTNRITPEFPLERAKRFG
jgi:hypothetical protein